MKSSSVFDQLFEMKYGNRSEGYDVENAIPKWDERFDKLLADMQTRKELLKQVVKHYEVASRMKSFPNDVVDCVVGVFEEVRKARFYESLESIIAQEALMIIYGIKICINLLSLVKSEEDAKKFYNLYSILHEISLAVNETYKNDKRNFWHRYGFKIGLHWLALTLKTQEIGSEFLKIDKEYGLGIGDRGRGTNPLFFILPSVTNYNLYDNIHYNKFLQDALEKEVKIIIQSGMKK